MEKEHPPCLEYEPIHIQDCVTADPTDGMTIVIAWINADGTQSAVVWLNEGTLLDAYDAFAYAESMGYKTWEIFIFNPADGDCLRKARRLLDEEATYALDE